MIGKLLASLFLISLLVGNEVLVMMYGWGVEPKSWWWIIGSGIFVNVCLKSLFDVIQKE